MILTGKAKKVFLKWVKIRVNSKLNEIDNIEFWLYLQDKSLLNALIIEWFDSVGIYISVKRNCQGIKYNYWYFYITDIRGCHLNDSLEVKIENDSRPEAIEQAIKKANEIYNTK